MPLTKEERAARRDRQFAEQRAKLEAELQATIDLVTAMFWNVECGENLSHEQIAACRYDRILGVLWCRVWDYAIYCSQRGRIGRTVHNDAVSIYLDYEAKRSDAEVDAWKRHEISKMVHAEELRAVALKGHPKARAMRRRYAAKKAS